MQLTHYLNSFFNNVSTPIKQAEAMESAILFRHMKLLKDNAIILLNPPFQKLSDK